MGQVVDWCGKDFDGLLVFDKCHQAKHCISIGSTESPHHPSSFSLTLILWNCGSSFFSPSLKLLSWWMLIKTCTKLCGINSGRHIRGWSWQFINFQWESIFQPSNSFKDFHVFFTENVWEMRISLMFSSLEPSNTLIEERHYIILDRRGCGLSFH